jgi:hypothetical protein
MPGTQTLFSAAKDRPGFVEKPMKETRTLDSGKRYIELFDNVKEPLPILRIIVGPSKSQESNFEFAKSLAQGKYPVTKSETPVIIQG